MHVMIDFQRDKIEFLILANDIFIFWKVLWIHKGLLPSTIYLQLDNTCKENKNMYVFAFLAYLVEVKVFDKVRDFYFFISIKRVNRAYIWSKTHLRLLYYVYYCCFYFLSFLCAGYSVVCNYFILIIFFKFGS